MKEYLVFSAMFDDFLSGHGDVEEAFHATLYPTNPEPMFVFQSVTICRTKSQMKRLLRGKRP